MEEYKVKEEIINTFLATQFQKLIFKGLVIVTLDSPIHINPIFHPNS